MSTNKTKNRLCESFDGFSGVDTTSPIGSGRLVTLKNFRLLDDGSAVKRSGFRHIATLTGELRGEKAYADGGEEIILCAVGKLLMRISVADGYTTSTEVFDSDEGAVKFFEFKGELYILEGAVLYRYLGGCMAEKCIPFIPLYGRQWPMGDVAGVVNQPFNMLTPKVKITYHDDGSTVFFATVGMKIKSIDAIYKDGVEFPADKYTIYGDGDKIKFDGFYLNGDIEVYLTLDTESYTNDDFKKCDRVGVFDAFGDSRVFAYGGGNGGRTYVSLPPDPVELECQNTIFGDVTSIYFPYVPPLSFSGVNKITDMRRIFDKMLVFSEHRTWVSASLRTDEGRLAVAPIFETATETAGCSSVGASELIDGDNPITVSHGGVIKWSIDREFEEKMRLSKISSKMDGIFDSDFVKNAVVCYNRGQNELWFANTHSENGLVAVYNCSSGAWYTFEGIPAESFLKIGEHVAFRSGKSYYIFDTDEGYDCFESGEREIEAVIESAGFDFSCPSEKKHVGRAFVTCDTGGEEIELELSDGEELVRAVLKKSDASKFHGGVDFFDLDLRTGRSERMKFKLLAGGRSTKRIYKVEFIAD